MAENFLQKHGHIIINHCCYYNIIYGVSAKFLIHAESVDSLPTKFTQRNNADIERFTGYKQTETAFTGSLRTFQLKRKLTCNNLLELFGQEKNQIQNLEKGTRDGSQKSSINNRIETSETEN